jgi:hypothetical protein
VGPWDKAVLIMFQFIFSRCQFHLSRLDVFDHHLP